MATLRSAGDSDLSQAGSVLGTPAYMAPEQARGETESVDRRADVFALGSILCEVLTGKPAFVGGSAREILAAAGRADTADALARLSGCGADGELLALARDCLAAEAKDRPADAGVVAGRLTAYLAGVQERLREAELSRAAESARAVEAEAKAAAERRARRLTAALAATVLLAGVLGGAGWRWVELQRVERVREASGRVNLALHEATRLRGLAQGAAVDDPGPWELAAVGGREGARPAGAGDRAGVAQAGRGPGRRAGRRAGAGRGRRPRRPGAIGPCSTGWSTSAVPRPTTAAASAPTRPTPTPSARRGWTWRHCPRKRRPGGSGPGLPTVATALAAAVDDWAAIRRDRRKDRAGAAALAALARAADPDDWRNRLRAALDQPDAAARRTALQGLAGGASYETLGPVSLDLLGRALNDAADPAGAEAVLRRAQQRYPGDVWINYDLAHGAGEAGPAGGGDPVLHGGPVAPPRDGP